ncbi:glycosyltransferase, partial [Streptomyces calidiresistens]
APDTPARPRGRRPRVVVISPPFLSHARPMSVFARALHRAGADTVLACGPDFAHLAEEAGTGFAELIVTRNANTGIAERTEQAAGEAARLREFLEATRDGAVPALFAQARHRRADLLADPDGVRERIAALHARLRPDWYVVDLLAHSAALALYCLGLPRVTFCPGHPGYLPADDTSWFGMPTAWPRAIRPDPAELERLRAAVIGNDRMFTELFATVVRRVAPHRPVPRRAFALCSPHAVVFNYPDLPWLPALPPGAGEAVRIGHCVGVGEEPGPGEAPTTAWEERLASIGAGPGGRPLVLVALGTFLSARDDVLRAAAEGILAHCPRAAVVVAAGNRTAALLPLLAPGGPGGGRLLVADSVPQRALLGRARAMVHHGGNNSFTECLWAGVPAVVLPFSSDQFAVAHDAERSGAGVAVDPNLPPEELARRIGRAVARLIEGSDGAAEVMARVREGGPLRGARRVVRIMAGLPGTALDAAPGGGTAPGRRPTGDGDAEPDVVVPAG